MEEEPEIIYVPVSERARASTIAPIKFHSFFQKIIQEMQIAYMMHGQFTPLDVENTQKDTRYVYFIRLTEEAIPNFDTYDEALAQMPDYVLTGSCMSNLLQSVIGMLKGVRKIFYLVIFLSPGYFFVTIMSILVGFLSFGYFFVKFGDF